MTNPLHRFFWEDSEFRGLAYALTAVAGILYATSRTLVFHRPERQVAVELFVLVLVLNSAAVAMNYLRTRESFLLKTTDKGTVTDWPYLAGWHFLRGRKSVPLRTSRLSLKVRYGG